MRPRARLIKTSMWIAETFVRLRTWSRTKSHTHRMPKAIIAKSWALWAFPSANCCMYEVGSNMTWISSKLLKYNRSNVWVNSVSRSNSDGVPSPISRPAILLDKTKFCGRSFWKTGSRSRTLPADGEVDGCKAFLLLEAYKGGFWRGDVLEQTEPRAAQGMHCWPGSAEEHLIFRDLCRICGWIQGLFRRS